eukprot:2504199-Alexandrium_andersonii.AAC.1
MGPARKGRARLRPPRAGRHGRLGSRPLSGRLGGLVGCMVGWLLELSAASGQLMFYIFGGRLHQLRPGGG